MSGMTRREAEADAWELGEHPCQIHGHMTTTDPESENCTRCGVNLALLEDDDPTVTRCAGCGVEIKPEYLGSRVAYWYDPDRLDLGNPATSCQSGDREGDEHEPATTAQRIAS